MNLCWDSLAMLSFMNKYGFFPTITQNVCNIRDKLLLTFWAIVADLYCKWFENLSSNCFKTNQWLTVTKVPPVYSPAHTSVEPYQHATASKENLKRNKAPAPNPVTKPRRMPILFASFKLLLYLLQVNYTYVWIDNFSIANNISGLLLIYTKDAIIYVEFSLESYSGITNSVLYNGNESGLFDVLYSTRQGSYILPHTDKPNDYGHQKVECWCLCS